MNNNKNVRIKAGGPSRPVLGEERLKQMAALASKVFRGEVTPKASCAEDVLYLVAEVRLLRAQNASKQAEIDSCAPGSEDMDKALNHMERMMDSVFNRVGAETERSQGKTAPKQTVRQRLAAWCHIRN